eukprot:TRINITY_DN72550_c0_g1_i1.p1 TRINITY_DN72550_c0_g1~~TRINITY_DN72550_c0_g1_i1.p1  ORF type:complete len:504 (-),score=25.29 TRINITY_DN72550_c0_g1_i1:8-1519(-)
MLCFSMASSLIVVVVIMLLSCNESSAGRVRPWQVVQNALARKTQSELSAGEMLALPLNSSQHATIVPKTSAERVRQSQVIQSTLALRDQSESPTGERLALPSDFAQYSSPRLRNERFNRLMQAGGIVTHAAANLQEKAKETVNKASKRVKEVEMIPLGRGSQHIRNPTIGVHDPITPSEKSTVVHDVPSKQQGQIIVKAWQQTIPANHTTVGRVGPSAEMEKCREALATGFPRSIWKREKPGAFGFAWKRNIPVDFHKCGHPHLVNVYYPLHKKRPKHEVRLPLISYAHGRTNGGTRLHPSESERFFRPLVERGFFIVAYQHGGLSGYCAGPEDQLDAIRWLKNSSFAKMVNFNRVAVMGHSMGGKATLKSAAMAHGITDFTIRAAVTVNAFCLLRDCPTPQVPTMFFSGSHDRISRSNLQQKVFNSVQESPAVFGKFEFFHGLNNDFARLALQPGITTWMQCHVNNDFASCQRLNDAEQYSQSCFGTLSWNSYCMRNRGCGN